MATAEDVLNIARQEIGYCRWDDNNPGTKYGRWYASITGDSYYGISGVPFCAMFVSWVLNQAGVSAAGIPGAYCPWIANHYNKRARDAQPGDMVLFDWGYDGVSDHIGFVEYNNGSYLTTIEGNTTGTDGRSGSVARRTRSYSTVYCVGTPNYWYEVPAAPEPTLPPPPPKIYPGMRPDMTVESNIMYRLYNPNTGDHFYTASTEEKDSLISSGWQDENVAWTMPNVLPIYRLYNGFNGLHFLTTGLDECKNLIDAGWRYEGAAGYASATETDSPIYCLYQELSGQHLYTSSKEEYDNLSSSEAWTGEGIKFYV